MLTIVHILFIDGEIRLADFLSTRSYILVLRYSRSTGSTRSTMGVHGVHGVQWEYTEYMKYMKYMKYMDYGSTGVRRFPLGKIPLSGHLRIVDTF